MINSRLLGLACLNASLLATACSSDPTGGSGSPATHLVFTVEPTSRFSGFSFAPTVKVSAEDANGQVATDFTGVISMDLAPHAAGKSLRGTTIIAAVGGVAIFADLEVDGAASGNLLIASAQGLTPATSTAFASHLTRLVFAVQPGDPIAGTPIAPSVQVAAEDSAGRILTGFTGEVRLRDGENGLNSGLTGTLTATAVAGVASFPNIIFGRVGTGWQLIASVPGFTEATSARIVSHAPRLVFTVQPSSVQSGRVLAPAIQVTAQDYLGHTTTGFIQRVTLSIGHNPAGAHLLGDTTVSLDRGVATFSNLIFDAVGTGYSLTAAGSSPLGVPATSSAFDVTPCLQACWTIKASMPTPRYDQGIGVAQNILYAIGGATHPYGEGVTGRVDAYDPAVDGWTRRAGLLTPRTGAGVGVVDGVLYAVGGYGDTALVGAVEAYDASTDRWTAKAPMPVARTRAGIGVINGVLYAMGGSSDAGISGEVDAYDPTTDSWTTRASMPTARTGVDVGVVNGMLYAVGGYSGAGVSGEVEAYDPVSDRWTARATAPTSTQTVGVAVVNGVLYQAGLLQNSTSTELRLDAFDPVTNRWTSLETSPFLTQSRGLISGVGAVNGVLYVPGAVTQAYQP
ncbi:MAG: kelch repeat-containing protein [Gemmatimonadota bacterium]